MPFVGTIGQIFVPEIEGITISILMVTIVASLINGPGEELFWRGIFATEFSNNNWLGIVYPAICFGLWHFALLRISGLYEGWALIIFGPMILGLCWGWIAQQAKSIFWISIAHVLVNFFALKGRMFFIE
jgi:membrane protease YdiL (CAAX protease family)